MNFNAGFFFICWQPKSPACWVTETSNSRVRLFLLKMSDEKDNDLKSEKILDFQSKEKQSARSYLRERFLRAVTGLVGKECQFHLYSNTNVEGIFRGCDIEFENLLVEKLKTPFAELPYSKIRSIDVNYISFKDFSKP